LFNMASFTEPIPTDCYASITPGAPLEKYSIVRRAPGVRDVVVGIKFAGICHSDIHSAREEWGKGIFPMVPGHEIGGEVLAVGSEVTKFSVGETVGVGVMVDSCRDCRYCRKNEEQYCSTGCVFTYNSRAKYPHMEEYNAEGGAPNHGGYSKTIVVDQSFVLSIPSNLDLAAATPLLCAGITTYSPLIHFGLNPSHRFGVLGLGGLGHMGVKFGKAFGAHTTVISRGTAKRDSALNELGAHAYLDSTNAEEFAAAAGTFDFILDTVSAVHDIRAVLSLLTVDGKLVMVGLPPEPLSIGAGAFINKRKTVSGSMIGGVAETQDMLDFCGRNDIVCNIELINASQINEAYERTIAADVKYRFVIDVSTI
jgi:alcohol dehydrogenase (NADP+)